MTTQPLTLGELAELEKLATAAYRDPLRHQHLIDALNPESVLALLSAARWLVELESAVEYRSGTSVDEYLDEAKSMGWKETP